MLVCVMAVAWPGESAPRAVMVEAWSLQIQVEVVLKILGKTLMIIMTKLFIVARLKHHNEDLNFFAYLVDLKQQQDQI